MWWSRNQRIVELKCVKMDGGSVSGQVVNVFFFYFFRLFLFLFSFLDGAR